MKRNPKIILLGDMNVGKTAMLQTLMNKQFPQKLANTLGACYQKYDIQIAYGQTISMDIWDTAGQEKYRSLLSMYYKNCDGIILVFDVTRIQTFNSIKYWSQQISIHCEHRPAIHLAANKIDLRQNHEVIPDEKIRAFARDQHWMYSYCSAKNQYNIEYIFTRIGTQANKCLTQKIQAENNKLSESYQIKKKPKRKKSQDSCC